MPQINVYKLLEQSSGKDSVVENPLAGFKATGLWSVFTDCDLVPSGSSEKTGTSDQEVTEVALKELLLKKLMCYSTTLVTVGCSQTLFKEFSTSERHKCC